MVGRTVKDARNNKNVKWPFEKRVSAYYRKLKMSSLYENVAVWNPGTGIEIVTVGSQRYKKPLLDLFEIFSESIFFDII